GGGVGGGGGEGLGPQGRGLVGGREPAGQQVGLQAVNLVGEAGQRFGHLDHLPDNEEVVVSGPDLRGQITAGTPQGELRVAQVHLGRRCLEFQFAAGFDNLIDKDPLPASGGGGGGGGGRSGAHA